MTTPSIRLVGCFSFALAGLNGRYLFSRSWNIEPPRAPELINPDQIIEKPLCDNLSMHAVSKYTIGVRNRDHGQAFRTILVPDDGLQGFWPVIISVTGHQNELFSLTHPPDYSV